MQDHALGLAEPHEVHVGPPLKPVKVPLDGIPSLKCVNCTTQCGVICKLAEGAVDPTVIDKDFKSFFSGSTTDRLLTSIAGRGRMQLKTMDPETSLS